MTAMIRSADLAIDLATARQVARQRKLLVSGRIRHAAQIAKSPGTLALDLDLTEDLARATRRLADRSAITLLTKAPVNTYVPRPKAKTKDCLALLDRAIQTADLSGILLTDACDLLERELNHRLKPENLLLMLKRNREFHSLVLYKDRLRLPTSVIVRRLAELHVAARFGGAGGASGSVSEEADQNPTY